MNVELIWVSTYIGQLSIRVMLFYNIFLDSLKL